MAKILATLIVGQHYHIKGVTFTKGNEIEINEELKPYLENNSQFSLNVIDDEPEENADLNEGDKADSFEEESEADEPEETPKQKGMVLKGRGAKNKQEGDK